MMSIGSEGMSQKSPVLASRTKIQKGEFSFFSEHETSSEDESEVDESYYYDSELDESVSDDSCGMHLGHLLSDKVDTLEPPRFMKGNSHALHKAYLIN